MPSTLNAAATLPGQELGHLPAADRRGREAVPLADRDPHGRLVVVLVAEDRVVDVASRLHAVDEESERLVGRAWIGVGRR